MSKFKAGDRVRLVKSCGSIMTKVGKVGTVRKVYIDGDGVSITMDCGYRTSLVYLDYVELAYPNPPHKHAECIKAWADGAVVQVRFGSYDWADFQGIGTFQWAEGNEYRIKPQRSDKDIQKDAQIERLEQQALDLANEIKKLKE